jgi:hypothetical protein
MNVDPALTLLSDWTVGAARDFVARLSGDAILVIRRQAGVIANYVFDARTIRAALTGLDAELDLDTALRLDEMPTNRTLDVREGNLSPRSDDILLRDKSLVGVVRGDAGDRAVDDVPWTRGFDDARPTVGVAPGHGGWDFRLDAGADEGTVDGIGDGDEGALDPPGRDFTQDGSGTNRIAPPSSRFRAFAALTAPEAVAAGAGFSLIVEFARQPQSGNPSEAPIIVPGAPETLTFVVQVSGFGFDFPQGIQRILTVSRDRPAGTSVSFAVEALEVRTQATRTLEVSFEYNGELCGLAWHDVVVSRNLPASSSAPRPLIPTPADQVRSGGTGVSINVDGKTPSLTVEIRTEVGRPEVEWLFHPREDIERPSSRITTKLEAASAEDFAVQLMAELPAAKGTDSILTKVRGMGRMVNRVLPVEFWQLVEATWRRTPNDEIPSLLLSTSEPFIPWELAWVDHLTLNSALLSERGVTEGALGALWRVGRWLPPVRQPQGADRPAAPPPTVIDADDLAVVIGDYASDNKIRPLPNAVAEGKAIALEYQGLPLTVTDGDVDRLMDATLQRGGQSYSPTTVHFAAHGQVSTEQKQYTGIVLSAGRRLGLLNVEGSHLGETSAPFVFLNACQVGTADTILSTYGGLAGAFIGNGCRGFLAPLWNVDDDVAKDIAIGFYHRTFNEGVSVGEAVRQIRSSFKDGGAGTTTPLAYIFYGHPDLVLRRSNLGTPNPH